MGVRLVAGIGAVLLPGWIAAAPYPVVQVPVYHLTARVLSAPGGTSVVLSRACSTWKRAAPAGFSARSRGMPKAPPT